MSDITAIEPTALGPTPLPGATIPPPAVSTGQPQATGGNADQPAVVVDLSAAATTSLQIASTALAMDPDQVDYALSWATGVNGFAATAARAKAADVAATAARWNEADVAAEFGTATAERGTAEVIGAAVGSPSQARYYAANLGIPILDSVSPDAIKSGASAGTISVGAFSFTHGGLDLCCHARSRWLDKRHQGRAAMEDVATRQPGRRGRRRRGGSPRVAGPQIAHRTAQCVR